MELISELELDARKIILPMEHTREIDLPDGEWQEKQFNYRLNLCDEVFYMVEGSTIIGHVGLCENQVKTIYVPKQHRGRKVATSIYEGLMKIYPVLISDDAREEPAQKIWEKFAESNPQQVRYDKKKDRFVFRIDSFIDGNF